MLYCGVPGKCGALGGNEVIASVNDQHAVRCCTEDQSVGWPYKCTSISGVYGESDVPQCYGSATFSEAVDICSAYAGGRLCSRDEMLDRCTRGTGCGFNSVLVFGDALLMAMQKRVRQMLSVAVEIVMEVLAQHKKVKSIHCAARVMKSVFAGEKEKRD